MSLSNLPPGGGFSYQYPVSFWCPKCDTLWDATYEFNFGAGWHRDSNRSEGAEFCPNCEEEGVEIDDDLADYAPHDALEPEEGE